MKTSVGFDLGPALLPQAHLLFQKRCLSFSGKFLVSAALSFWACSLDSSIFLSSGHLCGSQGDSSLCQQVVHYPWWLSLFGEQVLQSSTDCCLFLFISNAWRERPPFRNLAESCQASPWGLLSLWRVRTILFLQKSWLFVFMRSIWKILRRPPNTLAWSLKALLDEDQHYLFLHRPRLSYWLLTWKL